MSLRRPLASLRAHVVHRSLGAPMPEGVAGLAAVVDAMGFVQLDPIRAPARAQDLILRQRVAGYRAGDLDRAYATLGLDEDVMYAYGVVPPSTRRLLHPRTGAPAGVLKGLHGEVLAVVRERGATHPRELLATFGDTSVRNAWGGQSRATTRALEHLHYWGWLRVARREAGIRVYEPAPEPAEPAAERATAAERLPGVALVIADLFGPLPETSLRGLLRQARYAVPAAAGRATLVARLLRSGALERATVDGVPYVWPAGAGPTHAMPDEDERRVRLLAPFDPVVWDRRRLEHLWGWAYRFEAYTPVAKRQFGYYALPMLWGAELIGWANVTANGGAPIVETGFVTRRPRDRGFTRALDAEIARFAEFLAPA